MKLVASLTSPYARKIRVALAEKSLPFELEVDIPWLADTRVPSYNPLGKVPALVADDGELWFDSPVIAEYLDTLAGPLLLPADRVAALPVRQAEALADGITDAAVAAFLEGMRPAERHDAAAIERQLGKISRGLTALEARVAQRKGCAGEALTIADVAHNVDGIRVVKRMLECQPYDRLHIVLGMFIFLVFPFTRLVHIWSAPVFYVLRSQYQIVRRRET